jgi:hypothetical protein
MGHAGGIPGRRAKGPVVAYATRSGHSEGRVGNGKLPLALISECPRSLKLLPNSRLRHVAQWEDAEKDETC